MNFAYKLPSIEQVRARFYVPEQIDGNPIDHMVGRVDDDERAWADE